MTSSSSESEEIKALSRHPLAYIVWPVRMPKPQASYLEAFANHIKTKFNESSPNKYKQELIEFSALRSIALSTLEEESLRDNNSLKALKKYYCQLAAMLNRFKDCNAGFSWKDSFGRGSNDGNLEFEINNIMYDIAAVHNELGAKISRTSESLTKDACIHFSNALWWVSELRDNRNGLKSKEMGHDLLTFFIHVLQAQAQECLLSHSLKAGMKPENVSKISAQISNDYEVAAKLAHSPLYTDPLREIMSGASIFNSWRATVEFKTNYFQALTQALLALSSRDDSSKEIGPRIARLRSAKHHLDMCKKFTNETLNSQGTKLAFDQLEVFITKKLDKAIRYNDNVYHVPIPSKEQLAASEGKLFISPVPFTSASIPDFQDLFSNLVSIESVQVNSIYSQKKDDLARDIRQKVDERDAELAELLSTLTFDKKTLALPSCEIPDSLAAMCIWLGERPNVVSETRARLKEVDNKSEEIKTYLNLAQELLKRQPNSAFEDELKRFRATYEQASKSTQLLHKQLSPELLDTIQKLATTNNPIELLPSGSKSSEQDEEVVRRLDKLLDKVEEMKTQRANLLGQLTKSLDNDDVIKHVVAASSEHELKKVFDQEIQKHNRFLEPLTSNLNLQREMLDTLEKVSAQYRQVKLNFRNRATAMTQAVETLKKSYEQFNSSIDAINQGLDWNMKMAELVKKFYAKVQAQASLNDLLN